MTIPTRQILILLTSLTGMGCASQSETMAPATLGYAGAATPHIDTVTFKPQLAGSDMVEPQLHFHAAAGDVRYLDQSVIETTGPSFKVYGAPIDIAAGEQKLGAVYAHPLRCGPGAYRVRIRAFLVDRDGDRSNTIEYTIHCNGG